MKDKDRELRLILEKYYLPAISLDLAQGEIKALYKPLGKERLITILERNQLVQRFIIEHDKDLPTTVMVDLLAQAIINARGE